jgi:hypothetical protein
MQTPAALSCARFLAANAAALAFRQSPQHNGNAPLGLTGTGNQQRWHGIVFGLMSRTLPQPSDGAFR